MLNVLPALKNLRCYIVNALSHTLCLEDFLDTCYAFVVLA